MKLRKKPLIRVCVIALLAAIFGGSMYLAIVLSPTFFLDPLSYLLPKKQRRQMPNHHFLDYRPPILISPGLPIDILDQELHLQTRDGSGICASMLDSLGRCPSGSFIHESARVYTAHAERLLAIAPTGYFVLFLRESGNISGRKFIANETEADTLFFPFGQVTKTNIFNGKEVVGKFKKGPDRAHHMVR